ncbi:MAG: D-alanine--D-alanine ligase [Acidobacteria bacterium]|nr:D-alanine--D-alanine ligase [Acidobacteriota bacterium]MCB9398585.1 D-alanine--D-alanine ligase [Acidobacteriota bacterium]
MVHIALVFGGRSPEHEVSIVSARFVAKTLREAGYQVTPIGITTQGEWLSGDGAFNQLCERIGAPASGAAAQHRAQAIHVLQTVNCDIVFPLIHGISGEDGVIQGFCDLLELPFVGGDVLNQSICFDKLATRQVLSQIGLPQPQFLALYRHQFEGGRYWLVDEVERQLPYPLFIKPSRTGSSIGISKTHSRAELETALDVAFRYDERVVVEVGIVGREMEVSALGGAIPFLSAIGEIVPENEFYDYAEKYLKSSTQFHIPADLPTERAQLLHDYARRAWTATHCFGLARIDFMVSEDHIFLNEINTMPGFTKISMYPKLLQQSGISAVEALTQIVQLGLERGSSASRATTFLSHSDWFKGES